MTEETEACNPARLSMVVAESAERREECKRSKLMLTMPGHGNQSNEPLAHSRLDPSCKENSKKVLFVVSRKKAFAGCRRQSGTHGNPKNQQNL